jgi:hypothetical protein
VRGSVSCNKHEIRENVKGTALFRYFFRSSISTKYAAGFGEVTTHRKRETELYSGCCVIMWLCFQYCAELLQKKMLAMNSEFRCVYKLGLVYFCM